MRKMKQFVVVTFVLISLLFSFNVIRSFSQEHAIKVRLRMLPIQVTSKDGPVRGLGTSDFLLFVDGKPVEVQNVEELNYGASRKNTSEMQGEELVATNVQPRRIILILDHMSKDNSLNVVARIEKDASARLKDSPEVKGIRTGIRMSIKAVSSWLNDEFLPTDEVAIMSYMGEPLLLQPFSNDKNHLISSINSMTASHDLIDEVLLYRDDERVGVNPYINEYARMKREQKYAKGMINFLKKLGKEMAGVKGTKHIILFSEGFIMNKGIFAEDLKAELNEATEALSSSNCIVNTIGIHNFMRSAVVSDQTMFLANVARETGGHYMRARSLPDSGFKEVIENIDHYYELFFSPPLDEENSFKSVEVRMKDPGLKVFTSPGYLPDPEFYHPDEDSYEDYSSRVYWKSLVKNELKADFEANLLPLSDGRAALHVRTLVPNYFSSEEEKEYEIMLFHGTGDKNYKTEIWHATGHPENIYSQIDVLAEIPAGHTSFRLTVEDLETGSKSQFVSGVDVPAVYPEITISPLILFDRTSASVSPFQIDNKELVTAGNEDFSAGLHEMLAFPQKQKFVSGNVIEGIFLYRGPAFDEMAVLLKNEAGEVLYEGIVLSQRQIEELQLMKFKLTLPELSENAIELNVECRMKDRELVIASKKLKIDGQ